MSSTSRIVVSLVAKPSAKESRAQSPSEKPLKFDPKEFIIDQTPARALPAESTANRGMYLSVDSKMIYEWIIAVDMMQCKHTQNHSTIEIISYGYFRLSG